MNQTNLQMISLLSSSDSLCELMPKLIKSKEKASEYGNAALFDGLKAKAVEELCTMLIQMQGNMKSDTSHYKAFLDKAAKLRHDIAVQTGTPEAALFGLYRSNDNSEFGGLTTPLVLENYSETNKKIKKIISTYVAKIKNKLNPQTAVLDNSRYIIKLAREETDLEKKLKSLTEMAKSLANNESGFHNDNDEKITADMMSDEYNRKLKPLLNTINEMKGLPKLPEDLFDKNTYIYSGRIEIKIGSEWRTLTRHFSVLRCHDDGEIKPDNFEHYKWHGFVTLLHTSHREFQFHEAPMAQIFNQILDKNTLPEALPNLIREFEYRLHHICYFARGSAAINELMLEAIKKVICPQYVLKGNLEALAQPFQSLYMK